MVLASFPLNVHPFRLLIPGRNCERICTIHAPRTSSLLRLDILFPHTSLCLVQDLPIW